MSDGTTDGGDGTMRRIRCARRLGLAATTLPLLLALVAAPAAAGTETERPPNQFSGALSPGVVTWYSGDHPSLPDRKVDVTSFFGIGIRAAYARSFTPYFELEPAFEVAMPFFLEGATNPGEITDIRLGVALRGVLPLLDGRLDLTLELQASAAFAFLRSLTGYGLDVVGRLGIRYWFDNWVGVLLAVGHGYTFGLAGESTADGSYRQDEWRLLTLDLGVAYRF
jgi:hypothetical protein